MKDRMIPTSRLKAFFEEWLEENWEEDNARVGGRRGVGLLAFRAKIDVRRISIILNEEVPNVGFDFVDRVLVNLDCQYLWHYSPEQGGFSDYYQDEVPERIPESFTQARSRILTNAKKTSRKTGKHWLDVLHEKAEQEMAA